MVGLLLDQLLGQAAAGGGGLLSPVADRPAPVAEDEIPRITIGEHIYEMIPAKEFNLNSYDVLERYLGKDAATNPPRFLLGNQPGGDQSPKGIRYWRRLQPFAGS